MLPTDVVILRNIRKAMAFGIAPGIRSGGSATLPVSTIILALDELLHRREHGGEQALTVYDELRTLAGRHNALVRQFPGCGASSISVPSDIPASQFEEVTCSIDVIRDALVKYAPDIASACGRSGSVVGWSDEARKFLIALALSEQREAARKAPPMPGAPEDRIEINRARLRSDLVNQLSAPDLEIVSHERLSGGFSKETFLITTRQNSEIHNYIMRAEVVGGGYADTIFVSLDDEFAFLDLVLAQGVPVPRPIYLQTDTSIIGSKFILTARCSGSTLGDTNHATERVDSRIFKEIARILARIHSTPLADHHKRFPVLTASPNLTVGEGAALYLDKLKRWWDSAELRPSAVLTLAYDWLKRNLPANGRPASFIHGDFGFHNLLVQGPKVMAVLDWEGACIASPSWDLVAAKLMLDERVGWDEFAGWYKQAGGQLPSDTEMDYWLMMRVFAGNLTCVIALEKMFEKSHNVSFLELGLRARPYFLQKFSELASRLFYDQSN